MNEFNKIQLKQVCNHQLVYAVDPQADEGAGIDGTYISEQDFKLGENGTVDGVDFEFGRGESDTIECNGQTLSVNASANKLHIMGFSLWSDVYTVFKIVYENGETECVTVPFIDCSHGYSFNWFDMSSVGGDIKSHGVIAIGEKSRPVYIHHIAVDLPSAERIKEIVLPNNFFVHIMAITLETSTISKENNK